MSHTFISYIELGKAIDIFCTRAALFRSIFCLKDQPLSTGRITVGFGCIQPNGNYTIIRLWIVVDIDSIVAVGKREAGSLIRRTFQIPYKRRCV